ncbi:hypothetical protein [Burkholderia cenocepacia]|uniref:hypothetical protein n=1 Tax=Burkholderia cenocepacia TaxID=95486 RepID=UPI000761F0B5|nr:hypothetical protein [Burkholderia cenocepacia]KWU24787.1 hypothetical protein AS149_32085 [Burkholderia cenocepacia]
MNSMNTPQPLKKFDLVLRTAVVRAEKPTKGLDAELAPNENQMNRLFGFLSDGSAAVIADTGGRGGMDFNKLLGGKIFAVAADGFFPVYEKDEQKKRTNKQKVEDGKALYSSSGFYMLSSKDYPALTIVEGFTRLIDKCEKVLVVTAEQLAAHQTIPMTSDMDWEMALMSMEGLLGEDQNLVSQYDEAINKKRKRRIEDAKRDAEDAEEKYEGVEFIELGTSKKDGNPFIQYAFQVDGGAVRAGRIMREFATRDENDRDVTEYVDVAGALAHFAESADSKQIVAALEAGKSVNFGFTQGHVMRTSVQFRRKYENIAKEPADKPKYGDAVYIDGALNNWVTGIVSVMQSMHPNFPSKDYDVHHYVAAPRQREVGLTKRDEKKYNPPQALAYDLDAWLLK